jgi:hypothetical protein
MQAGFDRPEQFIRDTEKGKAIERWRRKVTGLQRSRERHGSGTAGFQLSESWPSVLGDCDGTRVYETEGEQYESDSQRCA